MLSEVEEKYKTHFVPEGEGYHGSRALWKENKGNEEYWKALTIFLENIKAVK